MKKFTLKKAKGRKYIELVQVDSDDWFYDIRYFNTRKPEKGGMITKNQIPKWTAMYTKNGYSVTEEDI